MPTLVTNLSPRRAHPRDERRYWPNHLPGYTYQRLMHSGLKLSDKRPGVL